MMGLSRNVVFIGSLLCWSTTAFGAGPPPPPGPGAGVTTDQASYLMDDVVTVYWAGITATQNSGVAIGEVGAPDSDFSLWVDVGAQSSGSTEITDLPTGELEARFYQDSNGGVVLDRSATFIVSHITGLQFPGPTTLLAPSLLVDAGFKNNVAPPLNHSAGFHSRSGAPSLVLNAGFFTRVAPALVFHITEDADEEAPEEEVAEEAEETEQEGGYLYEELEFEEEEIAEENFAAEELVETEFVEEVVSFVAELLSTYEAQDIGVFESLVSEDYREIRTSEEDRERLDYDALIDGVRYEMDVAGAFQIEHRILGVRSGKNGVRVQIQWQMRFENEQTDGSMGRKGRTELVVADIQGWQLIALRRDPLFGAITSESLEGRENPGRRERRTGRGR
jgi:hypothetical protein